MCQAQKQENISTAGKHHFAMSAMGSYQKLFPRCPDLQLEEGFGKTPLLSSVEKPQGAQRRSGPPLLLPTFLYSPGYPLDGHASSTAQLVTKSSSDNAAGQLGKLL